jgi:4-diphosphocytidyl-2-C-methyl-D-erythritol kinase
MITFPKAKFNFGLWITGKRPDGFHDIETIFYPLPLCDALEFVVASVSVKNDEIVVTGINIGARHENNLVIKAVRRLRDDFPVPLLKIHLHKAIPSGAGLGGGSSDAACMLRAVNRCFDFSIDDTALRKYALDLGSDCPFFLDPVPSLATGRGEMLSRIRPFLEGYHILLLNPGISISTKEAYLNSGISQHETDLEILSCYDPSKWKSLIFNDFERFAFKLYPQIADLKKTLYKSGAVYSSMSGSGSTVYGIFEDKPAIPEKLRSYIIYEGLL